MRWTQGLSLKPLLKRTCFKTRVEWTSRHRNYDDRRDEDRRDDRRGRHDDRQRLVPRFEAAKYPLTNIYVLLSGYQILEWLANFKRNDTKSFLVMFIQWVFPEYENSSCVPISSDLWSLNLTWSKRSQNPRKSYQKQEKELEKCFKCGRVGWLLVIVELILPWMEEKVSSRISSFIIPTTLCISVTYWWWS